MNPKILVIILVCAAFAWTGAGAGAVAGCLPVIDDEMEALDPAVWGVSAWSNGGECFALNTWQPGQVRCGGGVMALALDDEGCPAGCDGRPYASGEVFSLARVSYGRVEAHMRASGVPGTVTALFTFYAMPPLFDIQDEIDVEILGSHPDRMEVTYWTGGVRQSTAVVPLGFDASAGYHTYAFDWLPGEIRWLVDGRVMHVEDGSNGPVPARPMQIMMNLWPCAPACAGWCGTFVYPGTAVTAAYARVRYTPATCDEQPWWRFWLPYVIRDT